MIIYRIKRESGDGTYVSGLAAIHDEYVDATLDPDIAWRMSCFRGNDPGADGVEIPFGTDPLFGCTSVEQLRKWFPSPGGCNAMARAGGLLCTYSCPPESVQIGGTQVAFDRREAVRLRAGPAAALHHHHDTATLSPYPNYGEATHSL